MPKNNPTTELRNTPRTATHVWTEAGKGVYVRRTSATRNPIEMPAIPPAMHCMTLSTMNCRRTSRFVAPHPDLSSPQAHTHQHDVHDDDPADDHGDGAHHDEYGEKRRADAAPQGHITLLGADEKVGFHFAGEVAPCAQDELRLVLGLFKILRARLHVDDQACMCALDAQENWKRGHDEVVLVLAENAADLFHYAYH